MMSRLLGRLLRGHHAGEQALLWCHESVAGAPASIELSSSTFAAQGAIPLRCAGKGVGDNVSPALAWSNVPAEAKELVLVVEDADAPLPRPFVHLIVTGISSQLSGVVEGQLSSGKSLLAEYGRNGFGQCAYAGPRALLGHGPHRYSFQLLALDCHLAFDGPARRSQLLRRLTSHVIAKGRLDGFFERT